MKLKELKHDHSLTELLKVLIFSILMLLPFFAVGTTSLYVICNKNAYQSYSNSNLVERTSLIASTGNLVQGKQYDAKLDLTIGYNNSSRYRYSEISLDWTQYGAPSGHNVDSFSIYNSNHTEYYVYLYENDTQVYTFWNGTTQLGRDLTFSMIPSQDITQNGNQCLVWTTNVFQQQKLDNVFYYSFNKLQESDLFNWTQNTAIYTGVKAMTDNLEITTPVIAILIVYWFILTIIYVIIDIVLKCFTTLTHMLSQKS